MHRVSNTVALAAACACFAFAHGAHGATAAMERLPPGSIRPEDGLGKGLKISQKFMTKQ